MAPVTQLTWSCACSTVLLWSILAGPIAAQINVDILECEDNEEKCKTDAICQVEELLCNNSTRQRLCVYTDTDTSCCKCLEAQCYSNNECSKRIQCAAGEAAYCVLRYDDEPNECKCLATAPLVTKLAGESRCEELYGSEVTAQNKWLGDCYDSSSYSLEVVVEGRKSCICDPGCQSNSNCTNSCGPGKRAACLKEYYLQDTYYPRKYCGCQNYCAAESDCSYLTCQAYQRKRCINNACTCHDECTSTGQCPSCSSPPKKICFMTNNRSPIGGCGCIADTGCERNSDCSGVGKCCVKDCYGDWRCRSTSHFLGCPNGGDGYINNSDFSSSWCSRYN